MYPYLPNLSIIIPTLNNEKSLPFFLNLLKLQIYPKDKIEMIIIDGGSSDKTVTIAKKIKIKVLHNPYVLAEPAISLGLNNARGDLTMILAVDNYFKDPNAVKIIVRVFSDKAIYAAFPKHDNEDNYSFFSKYHNIFTDPFNHFVYGEAANARTFYRVYKTIKHNEIYDVYNYLSNPIKPMIAFAQGLTIRSSYRKNKKNYFDDCKPIVDLINKKKQIAYVHSVAIYHNTIKDLPHFIMKQQWATQNAIEKKNYGLIHRTDTFTFFQKIKIILWPIYAFSFILPLIRSFVGLIKDRQPIWLFHPIACWLSAYSSLVQILNYNLNKKSTPRQ